MISIRYAVGSSELLSSHGASEQILQEIPYIVNQYVEHFHGGSVDDCILEAVESDSGVVTMLVTIVDGDSVYNIAYLYMLDRLINYTLSRISSLNTPSTIH